METAQETTQKYFSPPIVIDQIQVQSEFIREREETRKIIQNKMIRDRMNRQGMVRKRNTYKCKEIAVNPQKGRFTRIVYYQQSQIKRMQRFKLVEKKREIQQNVALDVWIQKMNFYSNRFISKNSDIITKIYKQKKNQFIKNIRQLHWKILYPQPQELKRFVDFCPSLRAITIGSFKRELKKQWQLNNKLDGLKESYYFWRCLINFPSITKATIYEDMIFKTIPDTGLNHIKSLTFSCAKHLFLRKPDLDGLKMLTGLQELKLKKVQMTERVLKDFIRSFGRLTSLELSEIKSQVLEEQLGDIGVYMPNLKSFEFKLQFINNQILFPILYGCNKIINLCLKNIDINPVACHVLARHLPNLKSLIFFQAFESFQNQSCIVISEHLLELQNLKSNTNFILDSGYYYLSKLKKTMNSICINRIQNLQGGWMKVLRNGVELNSILPITWISHKTRRNANVMIRAKGKRVIHGPHGKIVIDFEEEKIKRIREE